MAKLAIATGNTANIPEANEPILWLAVVTMAAQIATVAARRAMSDGRACVWPCAAPSVRYPWPAGMVTEKFTALQARSRAST